MKYKLHKKELEQQGYSIINNIYDNSHIEALTNTINFISSDSKSLIKTKDLFAIRQFLKVAPECYHLIFNNNLLELLNYIGGEDYFLTKAIYFDKPKESNWFVAYHQDLSISVKEKFETRDYFNWTYKRGQYGVQPPLNILDNIITVRIHLDDTNIKNGALKVIPKSHKKIQKVDSSLNKNNELIFNVMQGGAMLMKPLTLHASNRTINEKRRRVIHLEFCNKDLTLPLEWLEKIEL